MNVRFAAASIIAAYLVAAVVIACTPAARQHLAIMTLDVAQCVLANQGEEEATVIAKCAAENVSPDDIKKLLVESRKASAKMAATKGCVLTSDGGK